MTMHYSSHHNLIKKISQLNATVHNSKKNAKRTREFKGDISKHCENYYHYGKVMMTL